MHLFAVQQSLTSSCSLQNSLYEYVIMAQKRMGLKHCLV
jgi:hypothetical protein